MKTTKKELFEFINSSIIAVLFEKKFNPREFSKVPFEEMFKFAKKNGLRYLGEGSSRAVFALDSKRVIKIAMNMKGIAQNGAELQLSHDANAPIARIYRYDTDMWWLVSELVRPITSPEEFKTLTGIPWQVLKRFISGGYEPDDIETFMGAFQTVRTCDVCRGTGKVPEEKCHDCKGHGVVNSREEVNISIPAGIANGEMMRMSGMGEAIAGGVTGDLYVKVNVSSHKIWRREGNDLVITHEIKLTDALLGARHTIEGLDGSIDIEIAPGASTGEVLRVKGRGVPHVHEKNRRGDALVKLTIAMPKKLSKKAMAFIEGLKDEGL
jgi:molecular chaperone DnaJ